MHDRSLHDALRDFAIDASALLASELENGAQLDFELGQARGRGPVLYSYRPLTEPFIAARWASLRELPTCQTAAQALGAGAEPYLRVRGLPGEDTEPALQAMLERVFEDTTAFGFPEARFGDVYAEVEQTLFHDAIKAEIVAPLLGVALDSDTIELGDGMRLLPGERVDAPDEAIWPSRLDGHSSEANVLCVLRRDTHRDSPFPIEEARARFRKLLTGMRLFKAGGVAFGPLGWTRANDGAWQSFPLGPAGHVRGEEWSLVPRERGELRRFLVELDAATPTAGVTWALARFEMGVERAADVEALSDYLLALRALLGGSTDGGGASLSLRLAALCAEERDRRALQRRAELALTLERFVIGGSDRGSYADAIGSESPHSLVTEIEEHLRALLRDVMCGFLAPDLRRAADDILLESSEPLEIAARDIRGEGRAGDRFGRPASVADPHATGADHVDVDTGNLDRDLSERGGRDAGDSGIADSAAETDELQTDDLRTGDPHADDLRADDLRTGDRDNPSRGTVELRAVPDASSPASRLDRVPPPSPVEAHAGVTRSDDWTLEDDWASYSAPV